MGHKASTAQGVLDTTLATQTIYVDSVNGNDTNDGFAAGSGRAKATLAGAALLLPKVIEHNWTFSLTGSLAPITDIHLFFRNDAVLSFIGEYAWNNISGPHTADIHTASTLGITTWGRTTDDLCGRWIKITSGVCSGESRLIVGNTTTYAIPCKDFTQDPGACTYYIVHPKTEFSGTNTQFRIKATGHGQISFQRLRFTNTCYFTMRGSMSGITIRLGGALCLYGNYGGYYSMANGCRIIASGDHEGVSTTESFGGVSCLPTESRTFYLTTGAVGPMEACYLRNIFFARSTYCEDVFQKGTRQMASVILHSIHTPRTDCLFYKNDSGYAVTKGSDSTYFYQCDIYIGDGVTFPGPPQLYTARVWMMGDVKGTTTSYGMTIMQNSFCKIVSGTPPTLSGPAGNFCDFNGTNVGSWAAVDGGTPYRSPIDFSIVTE